ncbi:hypothetical protein [Burkholderia sp. BCC0397]|uniref:hypothetical protein n=1 Tax=Burkholderia sp. BCC0397 TaxID=486876 RepID=UPI00158B684A|nr:hypothetical protein [Burkholderia sp. BCC0397]
MDSKQLAEAKIRNSGGKMMHEQHPADWIRVAATRAFISGLFSAISVLVALISSRILDECA